MEYIGEDGQPVIRDRVLEARIENLEQEVAKLAGVVMALQRGVKAILVAASIAAKPKEEEKHND
jgi:hypothetical protein